MNSPDQLSDPHGSSVADATPGPWELNGVIDDAGEEAGAQFIVGGKFSGLVGAAMAWPSELDSGDYSRVKANALLMAAAPELLDALQMFRENIEKVRDLWEDGKRDEADEWIAVACTAAKFAIKKATGT